MFGKVWRIISLFLIIGVLDCYYVFVARLEILVLAKKLFIKMKNDELKFIINVIDSQIIQALSNGGMMKDALVLEWMDENRINQMPYCMYVF
jgi:hypothetical protein